MKIAIPVVNGNLCMHFGHCQVFSILDVNADTKQIMGITDVVPPPHEPGLLPRWLGEKNVNIIIAGGMGQRAQAIFAQQNIQVIVGGPAENPRKVVESYLAGNLHSGTNSCDH